MTEGVMRRYENRFLAFWIVAAIMAGACGGPQLETVADSLEVVYLPLADKINVQLDVTPAVYFSDTLDATTVNIDSYYLEDSTVTDGKCDEQWVNKTSGSP